MAREKRSQLCLDSARETLRKFSEVEKTLSPPIDIHRIARWLGYQVIMLSDVEDACSALVSTRDRLIGINARHHRHRQRFSLGHELAHIILKHPPESRCTGREIAVCNSEADECAGELLIPTSLLLEYTSFERNPRQLARRFDVSEEAMLLKIRQVTLRQ